MKSYLLTFTLLFFVSASYASIGFFIEGNDEDDQDEPKINQVDDQGRKQGKWIFLGKDQPEKGYSDDGKISEGPFKDDRKNGEWTMYYKDGVTPKTKGVFKNNRPNGPFIRYHQNGKPREIGTFSKRKYSDSLQRFNEKGIKVYDAKYDKSGKESGTVTHYHDNGKPEFVYTAKNGVPTGKAYRYWPNGDVMEELVYDEDGSIKETTGVIERTNPAVEVESPSSVNIKKAPKPYPSIADFEPNGYNKIRNDDLELWQEGDFKNGLLWDGRLYVYDEDGLLLKVEVYKEGKYHSDGQL